MWKIDLKPGKIQNKWRHNYVFKAKQLWGFERTANASIEKTKFSSVSMKYLFILFLDFKSDSTMLEEPKTRKWRRRLPQPLPQFESAHESTAKRTPLLGLKCSGISNPSLSLMLSLPRNPPLPLNTVPLEKDNVLYFYDELLKIVENRIGWLHLDES